jgi:hypothetical protein
MHLLVISKLMVYHIIGGNNKVDQLNFMVLIQLDGEFKLMVKLITLQAIFLSTPQLVNQQMVVPDKEIVTQLP